MAPLNRAASAHLACLFLLQVRYEIASLHKQIAAEQDKIKHLSHDLEEASVNDSLFSTWTLLQTLLMRELPLRKLTGDVKSWKDKFRSCMKNSHKSLVKSSNLEKKAQPSPSSFPLFFPLVESLVGLSKVSCLQASQSERL